MINRQDALTVKRGHHRVKHYMDDQIVVCHHCPYLQHLHEKHVYMLGSYYNIINLHEIQKYNYLNNIMGCKDTLREASSQINVILQQKLPAAKQSTACTVYKQ